jgi:predicted permease
MRDVLFAWRMLRRAPLFATAAILTLGLGIGANTAIFTLVNAVLLKPLAVKDPNQLASIFVTDRHNPGRTPISTYNFRDLRDRNDIFAGVTAIGFGAFTIAQPGEEPRQAVCQPVTANYFDVLGVTAIVGRGFTGDEDAAPGGHPVAVLSYGAWARQFGSDRAVVGRPLVINGRAFTIVGVMPPAFKGTATLFAPDLWIPFSMYDAVQPGTPWLESRRWRWLGVVARLKPGVTFTAAQAAVATIARNLEHDYPDVNAGRSLEVIPLAASLINPDQRAGYVRAAWLLVVIVGLVLLIACANLANLLLARAAGRQKEIAVRLALGADRGRIVRQMLTESMVLAVLGGAVGLLLAQWMQSALWSLRPAFLAQPGFDLALDGRALAFAGLVSIGTGVLFGLVPALQASRTDLDPVLRLGGRQPASGLRQGLRSVLVVAEVAFSVVALAVAGLFLHSLVRAQHIDPGFQTTHLLTLGVNPTVAGYDAAKEPVWVRQTIDRISALPGVRSATLADRLPLNGGIGYTVTIDGQAPPPGGLGYTIQLGTVGPHYFDTLGLSLVGGRTFQDTDQQGSPQVAIINETMARRFWPGENPIGRRFKPIIDNGSVEIVGVVRDSRYVTLGEDPTPFFYIPLAQQPRLGLSLIVRAEGRPDAVQTAVVAALRRADPQLPIANIATMPDLVDQALWAPRTTAVLLGTFASMALLLAAIGIYGMMAYSVSQRTHELGLRMALGARGGDVLRMVVGQGMRLASVGLVVGLVLAVFCSRYIASLLYGVDSGDPMTLLTVPLVLGAASLAACWFPANRAARLDPVVVLRGD